jgi:hypothetical protein
MYTLPKRALRAPGVKHPDFPNLPVYAWYLNERERIRINREDLGLPAPWTSDPIFQDFRFTNIFRNDDRISRLIYEAVDRDAPDDIRMWNAVVFRTFNSDKGFAAAGGWQDRFEPDKMMKRLDKVRAEGGETFSRCYVMANSLAKGMAKHEMYIRWPFKELWEQRKSFVKQIQRDGTLQGVWGMFKGLSGYGAFVAYEMALDMEMIGVLRDPPDRHTWANTGPGARRGMNFVRGRPAKYNQKDALWLAELRELYDLAPTFLQEHIELDKLDMRLIENGLCESSKYAHVLQTGRYRRKFYIGRG